MESKASERAWEAIENLAKIQAETSQHLKEIQAETSQQIKELKESINAGKVEYEQQRKEMLDFLKQSKSDLDEKIGRWSTNHGFVAEEYFINSFKRGQRNFFGEKFDRIVTNTHGFRVDAEYDMALLNGKSVAIVEVKYKAHENDIPKVLKKAETFRINYPEFANHQIFLGLASMAFYPELENKCIAEGIAVIKQVGDTMVINDKHLKTF
jgi:hypothetical protein